MEKGKLKRLMTDVAQGKISKKEAEEIIETGKTPQIKPKQEIKGKFKKDKTNTQKRLIKSREEK